MKFLGKNHIHQVLLHQAGGSLLNTGVGTLGEHNGAAIFLQNVDERLNRALEQQKLRNIQQERLAQRIGEDIRRRQKEVEDYENMCIELAYEEENERLKAKEIKEMLNTKIIKEAKSYRESFCAKRNIIKPSVNTQSFRNLHFAAAKAFKVRTTSSQPF